MELHESFDVTKTQVSLLSKSVVTRFLEMHGTELNLRRVLRLVQVLADLHDLV